MDSILTWLVRFGHVAAAASWAGSYVVLAVVLVPALRRHPSDGLLQAVLALVRLASLVGIATMLFGLVLVARTRGYEYLLHGEWGGIVLAALVVAFALMGIGDSALRPALRRIADGGDGSAATRWAGIGAVLSVAAIAFMTRAIYATS